MKRLKNTHLSLAASTSDYSVCLTREGCYSGKRPRVTLARAKEFDFISAVPEGVLKTVGAKSPN